LKLNGADTDKVRGGDEIIAEREVGRGKEAVNATGSGAVVEEEARRGTGGDERDIVVGEENGGIRKKDATGGIGGDRGSGFVSIGAVVGGDGGLEIIGT
jgi:hypothetical protein